MMETEEKSLRLLCLGDSYTIGEGVPAHERFPEQAVALLKQRGIIFSPPHIVATTGWTTDELLRALETAVLDPPYDVVTLLIGVNNQYRGRSLNEYRQQFKELLHKAIGFAGGSARRVIVLSIPDWGATPYAAGRNRVQIAGEIDAFNQVNAEEALAAGANYLHITPYSRLYAEWVTGDGLHPDGRQYHLWAADLADHIERIIG
ncbi:MAG: GDSL-type esterase/lipase family protein [Chitinophagales bacterium]|nr:GDSL-type esterase/lipase family protein [Chitinophagales bacterium]MDW8427861.1 GDSL-type esterase/lipase family protein [Chitinophagales bacterium]